MFSMLCLPIHDRGISLHLFRSLISFTTVVEFSVYKSWTCFVRFTLNYFIFISDCKCVLIFGVHMFIASI